MSADDAPQDGQSRRDRLARILEDLSAKLRAKLLSTLRESPARVHRLISDQFHADSLELTLLLMWRHLGYYLEDRQTASYGSPDAKLLNGASGANGFKTQSLRSSIDLRTIKQNAQDAFSLVHERLQNLQLVSSLVPRYVCLLRRLPGKELHWRRCEISRSAPRHAAAKHARSVGRTGGITTGTVVKLLLCQ